MDVGNFKPTNGAVKFCIVGARAVVVVAKDSSR